MAKICRNYEIYHLEVPFMNLITTHEEGLHLLELKFLPIILTNFDGNFQSATLTLKRVGVGG